MFAIIKNEIKKYFKDYKNIVPLIIIFSIMGVFAFQNVSYNKRLDDNYKEIIESKKADIEQFCMERSDTLSEKESGLIKAQKTYLTKMLRSYRYGDKTNVIPWELKLYEHDISMIKQGFHYRYMKELQEYEVLAEQDRVIMGKNIKPVNEYCTMQGLNFLKLSFGNIIMYALLALVLFISCTSYASELQYKTYKLLYTQPIRKSRIFCGKVISNIIISFLLILFITALPILILTIKYGFGQIYYPTIVYSGGGYVITELWRCILREIILSISLIIFLNVFGTVLSMFISNISTAIGIGFTVVAAMYGICRFLSVSAVTKFLPFAYIDIFEIISPFTIRSGEGSLMIPTYSCNTGIAVNLIAALLMFTATVVLLSRHSSRKNICNV